MAVFEIGIVLAAVPILMEAVVNEVKTSFSSRLSKLSAKRLVRNLSERAKDISQVKTLLCLEQPVLITEFYSPQFIITPGGERIELSSPGIVRDYPRMVIAGVAGQGKSILFRYLALHEIANHRLPLFIELRNYEHAGTLDQLLLTEIETLGFPRDEGLLAHLLESGKCVLYLDAFDEIPYNLQLKARKQIEDKSRKHAPCNIYISSRPALNIEASNYFRVARLDDLQPEESKDALRRMANDKDDTERIELELESANHRLSNLLTTPLMVALLLLHYRLSGEFPETEQAFFGDLFDVLLRRHDQTKGYTRIRHSKASELELSDLFAYASFACRQKGAIELPRSSLITICQNGAAFHGRDFSPDGALDDIMQGTNLILEEGATCRFAHKAVQEFYAAKFLAAQPEIDIRKFLRNRVKSWDVWLQLLEFLELLNPFMFYKHFLLPHAGWICFNKEKQSIPDGWIPSKETFLRVFGDDQLGIKGKSGKTLFLYGSSYSSRFYLLRRRRVISKEISNAVTLIDWTKVPEDDSIEPATIEWLPQFEQAGEIRVFTMDFLLRSSAGDILRQQLQPVLTEAIREIKRCEELVRHRSALSEFFE